MSDDTRDWDSMEWLHIYGQHSYHSEATIRGTSAGLTRLRDAINAALERGEGQATVMASDGEGYHVQVTRVSMHAMLGQPEYIYETGGSLLAQEAERARRYGLRNPYGSYRRVDDPA